MLIRPESLAEYESAYLQRLSSTGRRRTIGAQRTRAWLDSVFLRPRLMVDVAETTATTRFLAATVRLPLVVDLTEPALSAAARSELIALVEGQGLVALVDAPLAGFSSSPWIQVHAAEGERAWTAALETATNTRAEALVLDLEDRVSKSSLSEASGRDSTVGWSQVAEFCAQASIPVGVRGIVRASDASAAVAAGCALIIASAEDHRDVAPPVMTVAEVCGEVGPNVPVIVRDQFRRGIDVLKCMALGAAGCILADSIVHAYWTFGIAGVEHALDLVRGELEFAMATCGVPRVSDIERDLVDQRPVLREAGVLI